jgi:hypothetical protein
MDCIELTNGPRHGTSWDVPPGCPAIHLMHPDGHHLPVLHYRRVGDTCRFIQTPA